MDETSEPPPLNRDPAFYGMTATQFLGAFNDNLFKQLMLLLAIPIGAAAATEQDQQGLATILFSLPFIIFSGYAGYLSDRFSKRRIIVAAKVTEIAVMLLGAAAFLLYGHVGYTGLLVVLFLMGMQSSFFGPGKYGVLPEMLHEEDLPRANGIILMTTFLAIILGTASAGILGQVFVNEDLPLTDSASGLWIGSAMCVAVAVAGTLTSLLIRRVPAAQPKLEFGLSSLVVPPDARRTLSNDRPLVMALLAGSMFWMVGGITIPSVNSLGMVQLEAGKLGTSILTAIIGLGIASGAVVAGRLCHGKADFRIVRVGLWGMVLSLCVLCISSPDGVHLLGFWGSLPLLVVLGVSAGFFAIPVQVFIQTRPPAEQKGRLIAVMNQFNFVAILLSGLIYTLFDRLIDLWGWPRSCLFGMMAILVLPLAIGYRPRNEDLIVAPASDAKTVDRGD